MKERYPNKRYQREQHPQQQPQQPQEAKRESGKWTEILTLFHQGSGEVYKKLSVQVSSELKVVLSITEGRAGGEYKKINFQLNEQELIFLAEKLRSLFHRLGK